LTLEFDEQLSTFAFNFNLRRYMTGVDLGWYNMSTAAYAGVLRAVAADAGYAEDTLGIFAGYGGAR